MRAGILSVLLSLSFFAHGFPMPSESEWIKAFRLFGSDEEAAQHYMENYEALVSRSIDKPARALVPISDRRYEVAHKALARIFAEFKTLYPQRLREFQNPPAVVIVADETRNAYAVSAAVDAEAGDRYASPYLFVIQSGLLDSSQNEAEIYGIIAHELTHLFLLHSIPENASRLKKVRIADSATDSLAVLRANEPAVENAFKKWLVNAQDVGSFPREEMQGLPTSLTPSFDVERLLKSLIESHPGPFCKMALSRSLKQVQGAYYARYNRYSGYIEPRPEDLERIKANTGAFNKLAAECRNDGQDRPIRKTFREAMTSLMGTEIDPLIESASADQRDQILEDEKIFNAAPDVFTGLRLMVLSKYKAMSEVEKKYDLSKVRYYSVEDEADDMAVQILSRLGMEPERWTSFFYNLMPGKMAQSCAEDIAAGRAPPYGALSDEHHSTCYRIYDIQKLAAYLRKYTITRPLSEIAQQMR